MRKKWLALSILLALFVMVSPAAAQDTIKIAAMEPLSGTFKDIGERYLDGVVYAAKVINASGGLLGKKVEVIPVDTELKPDVATRKAQNLILKDGVKFFCGGTGSSVGAAMSQLAEKQNVIMLSYGMAAASMTGSKCNRNFFRACGNTDQHSYALAALIAKKGYKKVAIIAQDYSFGKEAVAAFKKRLLKDNPQAKIVAELYHPAGTKDFAPYASQIVAAKPDVIFTPNWGNDLTLLLKQGRPMGMKQKVFSYYINDEVTIQSLGDDKLMIGDMGAEVYTLSIPTKKNKEFVAKFKKDKGYYPTWLRGKSYIATMFWAEAVKKAGTTDVNAVIKAWEGLSYDGPAGVWTMRACDHQTQLPFWYVEIAKKNPYFKHAFEVPAGKIDAKDVEVPCGETGCKMKH
ncbi:MAG TPA: ABC transporter substrate-binding protein [Syntrophales bacterium]|nr:ABC transporter substrate-binding protein [Syntrophales bacterium]HOM06346.1 ABC transporter substrate-binding protein [Syntrophales bacterium]HON99203.1 ABC transporter substrate-binding protein [Syntrophales bacterium]HPC00311.1 ABC transporter substrate-binding protein [Syntrophales bacterium]HPQ05974.1 ABC transporter substrate-binding protein [Syntrophales bacterium]